LLLSPCSPSVLTHNQLTDNFGNVVTDIRDVDLPQAEQAIMVEVSGHRISGLKHTYTGGEGLLALIGSNGYLKIAINGSNAASFLSVEAGDEMEVNLYE